MTQQLKYDARFVLSKELLGHLAGTEDDVLYYLVNGSEVSTVYWFDGTKFESKVYRNEDVENGFSQGKWIKIEN